MATAVRMPPIAADTHEGTLIRWAAIPGTAVERGDLLAEVETAKTIMEVEAPCSGVLLATVPAEGSDIMVGALLAWIGAPGEAPPDTDNGAGEPTPGPGTLDGALPDAPVRPRLRATPVVMRLAVRYGLDITSVSGTGPNGRITREDVERAAARRDDG